MRSPQMFRADRRRVFATAAALHVAFTGGAPARAQTVPPASMPVVIIKAARLIDGRGGVPIVPAMVRVDGERITAVGSTLAVPQGARVIDLGAATLLPGLIDLHTHLT